MDKAYKNFFREKKGFPKFKSKHEKQSVRFPVDAISGVKGNRINIINALKDIHYKCSSSDMSYLNKNQGFIKSGTLSKTKTGNYYFSLLIDRTNKELNKPINSVVGIDLGIKDFIVSSEGRVYENLKIKRNNKNKIGKLQRELSRKVKGSSNRNKARVKLAKLYEKLNNKKEYYLHSVVNQLLSENQTIVIEDLNVKGMLKNHKLAGSIQELSLYRFKEILKYKALWYGREVIEVDKWFPSSKLCSGCGYKNQGLSLKDRSWICPECGLIHDRDLNAALNIKKEGIRIKNKIGMSLPELTPLESKSMDPRRIRKQMLNISGMV
jgi:putative transposase